MIIYVIITFSAVQMYDLSYIHVWSYVHLHLSLPAMKIRIISTSGAISAVVLKINESLLVNLQSYSFIKINNDIHVTSYPLMKSIPCHVPLYTVP